jgi:hypothetical protein
MRLPPTLHPVVSTSSKSATDGVIVHSTRLARAKPLGLKARVNSLCKNHHDP